jgi:hypothetical protein
MRINKERIKQCENRKMTGIMTDLSIITLNVNGLDSPIKRHRLVGWIKKKTKQDPTICCL